MPTTGSELITPIGGLLVWFNSYSSLAMSYSRKASRAGSKNAIASVFSGTRSSVPSLSRLPDMALPARPKNTRSPLLPPFAAVRPLPSALASSSEYGTGSMICRRIWPCERATISCSISRTRCS